MGGDKGPKSAMPVGSMRQERKDDQMCERIFYKPFVWSFAFTFLILLAVVGGGGMTANDVWAANSAGKAGVESTLPPLKAGEKIKIDADHYFIYSFDKKPQMGTVIMKVQVFDNAGKQDSSYDLTGDSGMPSMRGAHDSGEKPFKLNKKGDYLLPVDVVMPGDWEVRVQFYKDKKPVFLGRVTFDV